MFRLNQDCWLWAPRARLRLLPQPSARITSVTLSHREEEEEEEEEEEGEHPAVYCCSTGCDDRCADARWSEPALLSGLVSSPGPCGPGPDGASSQQLNTLIDAGGETQLFSGAQRWEEPRTNIHPCVCVHEQRDPGGLGPCWPGPPYVCYGVRRNLLVGVEVVEEVAVEDTLEVITEDMYADDLLGPELLHDSQQHPT
ncbi:uncharacterized protein V6R79_020172 [Siganus canaliculatus]